MQQQAAGLFDDQPRIEPASDDHRLTPDELLKLWNAAALPHKLRGAVALNDERRKRIARLLREFPWCSYWQRVIDRILESDFCLGRTEPTNGRSRFVANFDFLTRSDTHLKVLEGAYDNRVGDRRQFQANQRRAAIDTLRGRRMTLITDEDA